MNHNLFGLFKDHIQLWMVFHVFPVDVLLKDFRLFQVDDCDEKGVTFIE
jgi:hypothetical protein